MDKAQQRAMQVYGSKTHSLPQKLVLQTCSWLGVLGVAWFLFGGGRAALADLFGTSWAAATPTRSTLLLLASAIYAARLAFTTFYLVRRTMTWGEILPIGPWLLVIHSTFAFFGGRNPAPVSWITWLGCAVYLFGSYLNTGSELLRHFWKQRPENKGRIYTAGLFKYSMHINYFGDVVLFSGFALIAGVVWAAIIPLLMATFFITFNIPMLDAYLAQRYAGQFEQYAATTKKFVPFIY